MTKIVAFPGNRKKIDPKLKKNRSQKSEDQEVLQEWLGMLKDLVVDLDSRQLDHPLHLKTYLGFLEHDEIIKMGQFLGFTEIYFHREEELLDFIALQFQTYFPILLNRLPYNAIGLLKKMMEHEGRYAFDEPAVFIEVLDFIHLGVAFLIKEEDRYDLVLTLDIMEQLEHVDWEILLEQGQSNTEILALTQGMLFCYGVMSPAEVLEVLDEVVDQPFDDNEVMLMLFLQCSLGATYSTDGELLWDNLVENPQQLYDKIVSREDLERRKFTKAQLLSYSNRPVMYTNNLTQWLQKGHRELTVIHESSKVLAFNRRPNDEG